MFFSFEYLSGASLCWLGSSLVVARRAQHFPHRTLRVSPCSFSYYSQTAILIPILHLNFETFPDSNCYRLRWRDWISELFGQLSRILLLISSFACRTFFISDVKFKPSYVFWLQFKPSSLLLQRVSCIPFPFSGVLEHERETTKGALAAIEAHSATLQQLQEDHTSRASDISWHAEKTFQNSYMVSIGDSSLRSNPSITQSKNVKSKLALFMMWIQDYEPSGETPLRTDPDLPSKGTIESLRAMPMDALLEEFRENNPYESSKEKPSLIPRSPLIQLNWSPFKVQGLLVWLLCTVFLFLFTVFVREGELA